MFSTNKYMCGKPSELESRTCKSPQQDQGRTRKLPYKLLTLPSSKCSLWDHTTVGDVKLLYLFYQRHPRVNIEKAILRSGHIFISPESKNAMQMSCTLCGRLLIAENEDQAAILFTKLKFNEEITKAQTLQQIPYECQVPLTFSVSTHSKAGVLNFHQDFKKQAVLWLQNTIRKKDAVVLNNFVRCKAQCQFENHNSSITCNIQFYLATLDAKFILKPILPITIILTALSRGLSDPTGNVFLHGESKSGYVTMDESRRILLVLDSDPKVTSLPIIGIWISGVETVQNPFVWASCIRYLNMGSFGMQTCVPPDPFLILVYEKSTSRPQFYDCILDSPSSKDGFLIYSGSCESVLDQADVSKLHEVREMPHSNDGQFSFTLKLMDDGTSVSQKITTTPCLNSSFESSTVSDKDLSIAIAETEGYLQDSCCKCLCKSNESYAKHAVEASPINSPKLTYTPKLDKQCMEIPLEDLADPNQNIYGLLKAQEQQLKQLKQQLDSLLHEKDAATLSPREDKTVMKTNPSRRTVNSAATMTSLAWPPMPVASNCPQNKQVAVGDNRSIEELPSPEIQRKQAQNSEFQSNFTSSIVDSFVNFQLPNFDESMESGQASLIVDLQDYPQSNASFSLDNDFSKFNLEHSSDSSGESASFAESRTPAPLSETEDDSTFYGNLLKKIQTILSHQESSDGNAGGSETIDYTDIPPTHRIISNERSSFDSLLIPHLNYVSMLPADLTSDQSLEFCTLALKYLNKCSTKLPPSVSGRVFDRNNMTSLLTLCRATESNLSFASQQYLDKHGLSSTANELKNISKSN